MKERILIVEDEASINELLVKILRHSGYETYQAFSGSEAKLLLEKETPDLILLDLMIPGLSGEELLNEVREVQKLTIPVLILSAKSALSDKVNLLQMGADDYITKPFEPEEVIARIQVALRRFGKETTQVKNIRYKQLELNIDSRKALLSEVELDLTAYEFDLLLLLMQNPEKVFSREKLYELVWNGGYYGENNTVNVHVSNLRKKLKAIDENSDYIRTVYGIGFILK